MSAPKRGSSGPRPSGSKKKAKPNIPLILDKDALGVFPINPIYKLYSIKTKIIGSIVHKNKEKSRELLAFLDMGNNLTHNIQTMTDEEVKKAINELFERDQDKLKQLLDGDITLEQFGALFFPEVFFSKVPSVLSLDVAEYTRKKEANNLKGIKFPNVDPGNFKGDVYEKLIYEVLKKYFDKDACLILHGHYFLHEDNMPEKDFIILNLSKGYIMDIEVKATDNGFNSAKQQVQDCRERIQAVFDCIQNMSSLWKFVGVCFIGNCTSNKDFVINGTVDPDDPNAITVFCDKLTNIEQKVHHSHQQIWNPTQDRIKEFVEVAKHLLFIAQGNQKAPLIKQRLIEKVEEDLDKSSTAENIFFWTPQQLSVVEAMQINYMFLMGYYGTGKTILLVERAEYLLRKYPNDTVHFYIDLERSGLVEVLELEFANKNIKIKSSTKPMFDSDFDFSSDGVSQNGHVIIDELMMFDAQTVLAQLKKFQTQVSTLWVALGFIGDNFDESCFRNELGTIQFTSLTLKHCLRNGQKIVELAQKDDEGQFGLNCFKHQVTGNSKSNVNDGLVHEIPFIYPDSIRALKEVFKKDQKPEHAFIYMREKCLAMSTLKNDIPGHDFVNFEDKQARNNWLGSSNRSQHLVYSDHINDHSEIVGMEFQSMIFVHPICLKCGCEHKGSSSITRAKASLVIVRFEEQDCEQKCEDESFPYLSWNKVDKKWEIEPGITIHQLPEDSREIFEKTSKLIFKP